MSPIVVGAPLRTLVMKSTTFLDASIVVNEGMAPLSSAASVRRWSDRVVADVARALDDVLAEAFQAHGLRRQRPRVGRSGEFGEPASSMSRSYSCRCSRGGIFCPPC